MINEEIKYNLFGQCAWHGNHFSAVKLAKVDWDRMDWDTIATPNLALQLAPTVEKRIVHVSKYLRLRQGRSTW